MGGSWPRWRRHNLSFRVSRKCDLAAIVTCRDRKEALRFLSNLSKYKGVERASSYVVLETIKVERNNPEKERTHGA